MAGLHKRMGVLQEKQAHRGSESHVSQATAALKTVEGVLSRCLQFVAWGIIVSQAGRL